jgi:subtilisin family serine protease
MDPRLAELALEGEAEDEVMAVLRLRGSRAPPAGVRVVARFGAIATVRLRRGEIERVRADRAVASMKAPTRIIPEPDGGPENDPDAPAEALTPVEPRATDGRRPDGLSLTGAGAVVGIIDWGLDFSHPNFRHEDGSTRLLALWDQRGDGDPRAPVPYGYGVRHDADAINRALASSAPFTALGYDPSHSDAARSGTHGTHVTDIAAGNGRAGPTGIAPSADLIFVHLSAARGGLTALGDSVGLLEAVDFIGRTADRRPVVINLSLGNIAGPHDGSTLAEQALDAFVSAAPGRAIVQSCGNYFSRSTHVAHLLRPGDSLSLDWLMDPADVTPNNLEIWYAGVDRLRARLAAPDGSESGWVALDARSELHAGNRVTARLYHRAHDPNNHDHHIAAFVYPGGPPGRWTLTVEGEDVVDGRLHAWIERDDQCTACQSRFPVEYAVVATTTGTICNGRRTIAVGAYDGHASIFRPAPFSSMGPTRDGRQKPDVAAPGVSVIAARSTPAGENPGEGRLTRKSGTSMAAPHVTGTVALMFEAAPRPLSIHETRRRLLSAADRAGIPAEHAGRVGSGRLDILAAVRRASAPREEEEVMNDHVSELQAVPASDAERTDAVAESAVALAESPPEAEVPPAAEAVVGQLMTSGGPQTLEASGTPEYSSNTLDDTLQYALLRLRSSWLVRGDGLRGTNFDCLKLRAAVDPRGADVLDADCPGCDAAVFTGEVYLPADLVGRGTRWVRLPRAREFYAMADRDQSSQRRAWEQAIANAHPALTIRGVTVNQTWLRGRSMPTLRGLIAQFAPRTIRIRDVNQTGFRGAESLGVTLPLVSFPIREPDCYLAVIAAREGKLEAINGYDLGAGISLGPIQFNLQRSAVFRVLDALQTRDPTLFREVLGADPQRFEMRSHAGHTDLVITSGGGATLHGRQADERRNIAWFQSGNADPAQDDFAHIDAAHRRTLVGKFRDVVAWPHVQELILETSSWELEPGLTRIEEAANGIPRLDPRDPDRTVFTLKALLLSAFVRFSACLQPLLVTLRRWGTPAEKLAHLDDALQDTGTAWGACNHARRERLRTRLAAQRPEADRVYEVIRRLRERQMAEAIEVLAAEQESEEEPPAIELDPVTAPCGGEIQDEWEDEPPMVFDDPVSVAIGGLDRALAAAGLAVEPPDLGTWLFDLANLSRDGWLAGFDIVGEPARALQSMPEPGDVLVERALGRGGIARVGVVTSAGPGPVETVALAGPAAASPIRRVIRTDGRLRPGTLLLRPLGEAGPEVTDPFECKGGVRVTQALIDAITRARTLAGVQFKVASPACDATTLCPTRLRAEHTGGRATHLVKLNQDQILIAEIAGLWGLDLHAEPNLTQRAKQPVKLLLPGAPFDGLNFAAIRQGETRELHLSIADDPRTRRVESVVDGKDWRNLAHTAQQRGIPFVLTKREYAGASLHRQWGQVSMIDWILGLAAFYLGQTGQYLGVGDISRVVGGPIDGHGTHKVGLDVDLYVVDFPNQSTGIPEMYFCDGANDRAMTLRPLASPASTSADFGAAGAVLAGQRLDRIRGRYATIVAYCLSTWASLNACVWHGVTWALADAQAIATAAARAWNTAWGPAPPAAEPAGPTAAATLRQKLIGQGHHTYNNPAVKHGWPLHQDHVHVRLNQ